MSQIGGESEMRHDCLIYIYIYKLLYLPVMKAGVNVILSSTKGISRRTAALKSTRVNVFISLNTCYKNELFTTN